MYRKRDNGINKDSIIIAPALFGLYVQWLTKGLLFLKFIFPLSIFPTLLLFSPDIFYLYTYASLEKLAVPTSRRSN